MQNNELPSSADEEIPGTGENRESGDKEELDRQVACGLSTESKEDENLLPFEKGTNYEICAEEQEVLGIEENHDSDDDKELSRQVVASRIQLMSSEIRLAIAIDAQARQARSFHSSMDPDEQRAELDEMWAKICAEELSKAPDAQVLPAQETENNDDPNRQDNVHPE